jgi:biopolymer transport protein ExbD
MRLNRRKKPSFLGTAASNDVAFLLIIYFMVIAGFNINKGFLMNLPEKDSTRMVMQEDLLRFDMDESGNMIYKGEQKNTLEVKNLIQSAQRYNPNIAVLIIIEEQTKWQKVVSIVELAQELNIDSFSFSIKGKHL